MKAKERNKNEIARNIKAFSDVYAQRNPACGRMDMAEIYRFCGPDFKGGVSGN